MSFLQKISIQKHMFYKHLQRQQKEKSSSKRILQKKCV